MVILDDFLDQDLWLAFNDKKLWENNTPYSWFDDTTPMTVFECVAKALWDTFDVDRKDRGSVGMEYWTNILSPQVGLDWHYDKDETHWEATGKIVAPMHGSVIYPYHQLEGGYLEIRRGHETERIAPVPNRAIFFEAGSAYHRVSDIKSGTRKTFACNLWGVKPSGFV